MSIPEHLLIKPEELKFIEKIGKGSYGEVWKAIWDGKGGGVTVAVKRIGIYYDTLETRARVTAELTYLSEVRHPNVIAVFGGCFVTNEFWIVMELMEGGTLYELLHSGEEIAWDMRLRLAQMVSQAVLALHSHTPPILHRDIKSPNFLISKDASVVKVIDFGVAMMKSFISSNPREAIGTSRWAAPETLVYPPTWALAADIYSLGMVFYEIASRKIPFEEIDDKRVIYTVQLKYRPEIPNDCPKEFVEIISKCWVHDSFCRPHVDKVMAELEKIISSGLLNFQYADNKVTAVDKFEPIRIIGTNDFSEVWQAEWNEFGGFTVVVKKLLVQNLLEEKKIEILHEVNILSKVRHPNIVLIYETYFVSHGLWIIMEFMEGGNLLSFLQTNNPAWIHRLKLAYQATKALNVLHTRNPSIVHRNIKAMNFLLSKDLSNVKLSDIGMSNLAGIISTQQYRNVRWAAPETFQNPSEWTTKSDIYSLGMTFFEIASLQIPYHEVKNDFHVMYLVKHEKRPSFDNIARCPKEFVDIIKQCWHSDPNKRPTSSQLLENFNKFIVQEIPISHIIDYSLTNGWIIQNDNLVCTKQVGASENCEVWKAKWNMNGKINTVALKKLHICGPVQKCVEAILSSVDILCSIQYPSIVSVYGVCIHTKEVWVAMEYMAGESLYNYLHTTKLITWNIQLWLAYYTTKAVHELHSTNNLHKNIQSLKFLLSKDGSVLKLGSFGLSKLTLNAGSITQNDDIGIIRWGAPETFDYPPKWSPQSDIYSLGCVFYEIMSQQIPYEMIENPIEIINQIVTYKHPNIPKYPQNFDEVILQCWDRDQSKRLTTEQILTTLKTLLDDKSYVVPVLVSRPASVKAAKSEKIDKVEISFPHNPRRSFFSDLIEKLINISTCKDARVKRNRRKNELFYK